MPSFSTNIPEHLKYSITFSSGELARQANGSVVVSYGDTRVLVAACMSSSPKVGGGGFLPLTVDYQEKSYAAGKIPGGFLKRDGMPKDGEKLTARLIDRPLRPLFPEGFNYEVQVIATVLCSDCENDPDVLAVNGASCALTISDIPYYNPVAAVRVCKTDGKLIVNPTFAERENQDFEVVAIGTSEKIVVIEGELKETQENEIVEALKLAHDVIKGIIAIQLQMKEALGKEKREIEIFKIDEEVLKVVSEKLEPQLENLYGAEKDIKKEILDPIKEELKVHYEENEDVNDSIISEAIYQLDKKFFKKKILKDGIRPDKRNQDQIRDLDCKVGILPRSHGSAVFTRGQTQCLSIITLGTSDDEQTIESLAGRASKHFMLSYSFPPYSVGEVRFLRGPSRRETGHGALAEKSLVNMLPSKEDFPYTTRIVSEILESNGSSSMATVCAGSLSLMDAGVPIKNPVAGIAIGIVTDGDDNYKILTDIAGVEDHCGEMDFKVSGTKNGVCAIQLDVKNNGLTFKQIEETLEKAKKARALILEVMTSAIAQSRQAVSKYAPKIETIPIQIDKIGELIGPGGRNIRKLTREYNVEINIDDEAGRVFIVAQDADDLARAVKEISASLKEVEAGEIYENAKVAKITNFGAFCDLPGGKSGLVHVSELSNEFVKEVTDVVKEGDVIKVKVIAIDNQGRINLSKKQAE